MTETERKKHWEHIYETRPLNTVSWYQPVPDTSLSFIRSFNIPKDAAIIDIGGGDSFLVDHLLDLGFTDVTVLDISEKALERVKERLGAKADLVKWIVSDVIDFNPERKYDFWHDRAAFHFLTTQEEIDKYVNLVESALKPEGYLVIGTFSETGPEKCSGLQISQYSEKTMSDVLEESFQKIRCIHSSHRTPSEKIQDFIFCSFQPRPAA